MISLAGTSVGRSPWFISVFICSIRLWSIPSNATTRASAISSSLFDYGNPTPLGLACARRSDRKQRNRQALVSPEQDCANDRVRPEARADLVERLVERDPVVSLQRKHELQDSVVVQVGDRDADER